MKHHAIAVACYAILHAPDGTELRFDVEQMPVVRPAETETVKRQVHHAVNSIVYSAGQKFGVIETPDQVQEAMHHCVDGDRR
jgi:hypothetical protein